MTATEDQAFLDEVNATPVTAEHLRRIMDGVHSLPEETRAKGGAGLHLAAFTYRHEPDLALAVIFRIEAMARLGQHPKMLAFSTFAADGSHAFIDQAVIAAASYVELRLIDGRHGFDPGEFFDEVLHCCTVAGES